MARTTGRHSQFGSRRSARWLVLAGALATVGCETPQSRPLGPEPVPPRSAPKKIDTAKVPTRDDIISIYQMWPNFPWLTESDRAVGFRVTTYFVSGETEQGAFVPGKIYAWIYTLSRDADGKLNRELAHVWEFDEAAASAYRVRYKAIAGYFYGFMLAWPNTLDLGGKLVEIEFGYERQDKTVVMSAPRRFRVPLMGDDAIRRAPKTES